MNQPANLYEVTAWERDGLATFEISRARLLDLLEDFSRRVFADEPVKLITGGETALLDDVAALRPDLQALLTVYNAAGRVTAGTWYVQPAGVLISGEALVRNLLAARADADQYGLDLAHTAWMPFADGYPGQLPQILCDFGINALVTSSGGAEMCFRWQGPDGTGLLVVNLNAANTAGGSGLQVVPMGAAQNGAQIGLDEYIGALRAATPDTLRPVIEGELFQQTGTLSARMPVKQRGQQLQQQLTYEVEPLLALAFSDGQQPNAANLRALLRHSWRLLLRNQLPSALGGTGSDAFHAENELRARQVADLNPYIVREALRALPGRLAMNATQTSETYIVVWNPCNWQSQQAVSAAVNLAEGHFPMRLLDAEEREVPFSWQDGVLRFVVDAPAVGYTTYTLQLTLDAAQHEKPSRSAGTSIGSTLSDERLMVVDDRLVWRYVEPNMIDKDGQMIRESKVIDRTIDFLRFFDGGDAGDTLQYRRPDADLVVQATLLTNTEVETSQISQQLIMQHRLRLTPALNEQLGRQRGVKSLDLTTRITMYHHLPGMYFQTVFENTVKDHRLRAHIRTGLKSDTVLADSAFALVRRPLTNDTRPMHSVCAVDDGRETLALLARGLPEYEAIAEYDQVTLALTLLRAVGWRSRKPALAAPDAQCLQMMTAEYALRSLPARDPAALLRAGQLFSAPLQAYHYDEPPPIPSQSYLVIEGEGILLTALKPPENGDGWIVRLLNPTPRTVEASLHTASALRSAQVVSMSEEQRRDLPVNNGSGIKVTLQPQQIVTLRLTFKV